MPVQRCSYVKSQEADIEDVFLFFHPTRQSRQERRLVVIIYSGCLAWSFLFPCRKCDIMMSCRSKPMAGMHAGYGNPGYARRQASRSSVFTAKEHKQVVVAARVVRSSGKRHALSPIPNSHDCCSHPTSSFPPQARLTESSQGQSQPMESSQHAILIR